jgi:subtilisin family serine protease
MAPKRLLSSPSTLAHAILICAAVAGCHQQGSDGAPGSTEGTLPSARPAGGKTAARAATSSQPARVIVKVRGAVEGGLAAATRPQAGTVDFRAAMGDRRVAALLGPHKLRAARPLLAARVRMKAQLGLSDADIARASSRRFPLRAARSTVTPRVPDFSGTYVLDLGARSRDELAATIAALRADPDVVYAEEDVDIKAQFVPNDPLFPQLTGLTNIGAPQAWDTARGSGVVVAVADTGLNRSHVDIDANVWTNPGEIAGNGLDDDGNGLTDDVQGWDFVGANNGQPTPDNDPADRTGHGSHVAGTIAAEGNNATGVVGVAFLAKVMPLKVFDDGGRGSSSATAAALVYAADEGADVINLSLGGAGGQAVFDAIEYAHQHGVVIVASAGNDNTDAATNFPAGHPRALSVAAVDLSDVRASFSNWGSKLDLAAPGVGVLSLDWVADGYFSASGTSMASPHVAGVAALVLGVRPTLTVEQVRQTLRASAVDLGATGKDPMYGYGRVSASNAVLLAPPLEAKIYSPFDGAKVQNTVALVGTARGPGFVRYIVEVGAGESPATWTTIRDTTTATAAAGGDIGSLNTSTLADGLYTIRLRAIDNLSRTFSDQIQVVVRYAEITSPGSPNVPSMFAQFKSGAAIFVGGRATGPSFQSFRIEWAPGRDASTGFSAAGVTLTGGGSAPLENTNLGTWTTPAAAVGPHTIRLSVTNSGFTSRHQVTVYLEPDLLSENLPAHVSGGNGGGPVRARTAGGSTRFILCGTGLCSSVAADGSATSVAGFDVGPPSEPGAAAGVDPAAGDEVVVADGGKLKIFAADLTPLREITTTRPETFSADRVTLADLDGDGATEIVALARDTDAGGGWLPSGSLHVYRGNGQLYAAVYPVALSLSPGGYAQAHAVAADLNGDGRKEVVVVLLGADFTSYEVRARNADGTAYAGWPSTIVNGQNVWGVSAADLDHDGRPELLIAETASGGSVQLRVLNSDGTTRPGWPVEGIGFQNVIAVGDLDRDQREEIVGGGLGSPLVVYRHDGTSFGGTWPALGTDVSPIVIADVNNDTFPDVIVSDTAVVSEGLTTYKDTRLRALSRTGALIKEWRLLALPGLNPHLGAPAVGDFNGDGRTDIAVNIGMLGSLGGLAPITNSQLSVLTTNALVNPAADEWPFVNFDSGNSRSKAIPGGGGGQTTAQVAAAADAYVRNGTSAGTNFGNATTLQVKNSSQANETRLAYLRFPLTSVAGPVSSARLRLFGGRPATSSATDAAFAVASNTWTETGITFNNRPALGAKQGASVVVGTAAQYYEWDVSAFVAAQKTAGASAVSLAVTMETLITASPDSFNSRQASANRPELVVVFSNAGTLPGAATNPSPANAATGVATSAPLGWTAGSGATSHDVYFGTSNPPAFRVNQTATTHNPGALAASTTYFWRIDGRNAAGTTTGPVWSFTTAAACTPETNAAFCARLGKNCGTVMGTDNCGAARTVSSCGSCTAPQTCGGGGTANVCGGGGSAAPCDGLCSPPTPFTGPNFNSGNLGTSATCHQTSAALSGANCGNFASGRTFSVNGTAVSCTGGNIPLPAPRNGGYCFRASAGDHAWAYFSTW